MKADFKLHHEEDRRLSIFFFGTLARRPETLGHDCSPYAAANGFDGYDLGSSPLQL